MQYVSGRTEQRMYELGHKKHFKVILQPLVVGSYTNVGHTNFTILIPNIIINHNFVLSQ